MSTTSHHSGPFSDFLGAPSAEHFKPPEAYRILNDVDSNATKHASSSPSSFPHFRKLPLELRLRIWTLCFPSNRLISIFVTRPTPTPVSPSTQQQQQNIEEEKKQQPALFTTRNHLGNLVSGDPYHLNVAKFGTWAPAILSSVNREARQAFLAFYRVAIAIWPDKPDRLRLNPDTDILEVQLLQHPARVDALVSFFHDAVASDPRGVGIAHLAMGRNMNDLPHLADLEPSTLHPSAARALQRLFSQSLRTFYACVDPGSEARTMLGQLSWPRASVHQNRAAPLLPHFYHRQATDFEWVGRDPRPVGSDLAHLAVGTDPRRDVYFWRALLAKHGVPPSTVPVRYLYAVWEHVRFMSPGKERTTPGMKGERGAFIHYLREQDASWAKWMADLKMPLWGQKLNEEEHARLGRDLPDAAGFWLFDSDTFGVIPDKVSVTVGGWEQWGYKMVVDLTQHEPELGLFRLDD
ncbi:hypothetical protein PG987_001981 [Apiospora arundinis]